MKNYIFTLATFLLSFSTFAAFDTPVVPVGSWSFRERYNVTYLRMAEVVEAPDKVPSVRVRELRQQGFQCIHKSQVKYLCTKFVKNVKLNRNQENFLFERFRGFQLQFLTTQNKPQVTFDGSSQIDYFMLQNVKIQGAWYSQYGMTVMSTGEVYFKFVSNSQDPNFVLLQVGDSFALPMILQTKVDMQNWGYYINVLFDVKRQ